MNRLLFAASLALASSFASATVLTFDELDGTKKHITDGYGGFNWSDNFYSVDEDWYASTNGTKTGVISHRNVLYSAGDGGDISLANGDTFTFNGAYFTRFYSHGDMTLALEGYKGGVKLFSTQTYAFTDMNPQWIGVDWSGIDTVSVVASWKFVVDNFTYNEAPVAVDVPEPAPLTLFGLGVLGLMAARRCKA